MIQITPKFQYVQNFLTCTRQSKTRHVCYVVTESLVVCHLALYHFNLRDLQFSYDFLAIFSAFMVIGEFYFEDVFMCQMQLEHFDTLTEPDLENRPDSLEPTRRDPDRSGPLSLDFFFFRFRSGDIRRHVCFFANWFKPNKTDQMGIEQSLGFIVSVCFGLRSGRSKLVWSGFGPEHTGLRFIVLVLDDYKLIKLFKYFYKLLYHCSFLIEI